MSRLIEREALWEGQGKAEVGAENLIEERKGHMGSSKSAEYSRILGGRIQWQGLEKGQDDGDNSSNCSEQQMNSKCRTKMVEVAAWLEEGMKDTGGQEEHQRSRNVKPGGEDSGTSLRKHP